LLALSTHLPPTSILEVPIANLKMVLLHVVTPLFYFVPEL
jgi:hypothetical protein